MRKSLENNLQQQCFIYFTNKYCLKHHNPRGIIFSIPNGGTRDIREAMTLKATGLLKGASDLVLIFPNGIVSFVEFKLLNGTQSSEQKDFQERVNNLGFNYHLIRSLEDFAYICSKVIEK